MVSGASNPRGGSFEEGAIPFAWTADGRLVNLGLSGFETSAEGINDAGVIVCDYIRPDGPDGGPRIAFIWKEGVLTRLPDYSHEYHTRAVAINNAGIAVGECRDGQRSIRAVYWDVDGQVHRLPTLEGSEERSDARDVNDRGEAIGEVILRENDVHPAVRWNLPAGTVEDLSDDIVAWAINDAGEIVGFRFSDAGGEAALHRDGVWYLLLNDLIPPDSGWELDGAYDINDAGEIVGWGYHDGFARAFLLIPEGELRSTGAIPGMAGRVNEIRVHGARPDARLLLFYSLREGSRSVPGCPGLSLSLDRPQPVASPRRADAEGEAVFRAFVPPQAQGKTVILQAVDLDNCEVSRPVWHHFPDVD